MKRQVASGRDNSTDEVVRDGLCLLQNPEDLCLARLGWQRSELLKGLASGAATPLDLAEVKAKGQRLRASRLGALLRALVGLTNAVAQRPLALADLAETWFVIVDASEANVDRFLFRLEAKLQRLVSKRTWDACATS